MLLNYLYTTLITCSDKVTDHTFTTRCVPFENASQHVMRQQVTVIPSCPLSRSVDAFGNTILTGRIARRHDLFVTEASGLVETTAVSIDNNTIVEPEPPALYSYPTTLTRPNESMTQAVRAIPGSVGSMVWVSRLIEIISSKIRYEQGVTTIRTTAAEAWELGYGVCQDFAHVAVAMCRLAGRPARYVVGLMLGEGATHAWAEFYDGRKWVAFDPTNSRMVGEGYIQMAHGRDFEDCSISRGAFMGVVDQQMSVSVDVW